jgi:AAA family ATP:ADP antiporter
MSLLRRVVPVRDGEVAPMLLATAYGFAILFAYYILRPVRDEISAADRGNLQYLWTAAFFVMLVAVPAYSALVARFSRGVFIPVANRFFAVNILLFFGALYLLPESMRPWIDRVFYVWTSMFALFVVTVFWGFIADLFRNEQSRRLFGFIAVGSSLGGILGSLVTATLVQRIPVFLLLLLAVIPLEAAAWLAWALHRRSKRPDTKLKSEGTDRIGGTAFSGIATVFRSRYLRTIAMFLALMTFASTMLYFQQAFLVGEAFSDRAARTALFAKMDLAVNILTIGTQGLIAAHVIRRFGLGVTLAIVPAIAFLGFGSLGVYPTLAVLVIAQVLYRSLRYALAKPAREVLYTVIGREERYKSKAFIDTAVYRGGDLVSGWIYAGLAALGLSVGAIALVSAPVAAVWVGVGLLLGRREAEERARCEPTEPGAVAAPVAPARATSPDLA